MKWEDYRMSENVDDRRGGGGGGGGGVSGSGLGIGTMVVLGLLGWALGVDPRMLIAGAEMMGGGRSPTSSYSEQQRPRQSAPPSDNTGRFVSAMVAMNEDVWKDVLPQQTGVRWRAPTFVMFDRVTHSACGTAQSAMGPFYCPRDQKVYLDTSFFREMDRNLGGGGQAAYAYVIAHEIAHHIENLMGILPRVQQAMQVFAARGAPNAFGFQRFGHRRNGHLLGMLLAQERWQELLDELVGARGTPFPDWQREAREDVQGAI
jgi:predicted metalloprotease